MEATKVPHSVRSFKISNLKLVLVTVYNDRADVKRLQTVDLEAGINEIIFENMSRKADSESIRVDVSEKVILHEVQMKEQPALLEEIMTPKVKALYDERKELEMKKQTIEDEEKIFSHKNEILDKIIGEFGESVVKPKDKESAVIIDENSFKSVENLFSFYGTQSLEIRSKLRELQNEKNQLNEKINKISIEIERNRLNDRYCRNVHVMVEVKEAQRVNMYLGYQVYDAFWRPIYDIRLQNLQLSQTEKSNNLQLVYHGLVHQNTEEDWNETSLKLSTAQPSLGAIIPQLGTLKAYIYQPPPPPAGRPLFGHVRAKKAAPMAFDSCMMRSDEIEAVAYDHMGSSIVPVTMTENVLSTVFDVPRQASINSGSGEHKITFAVISFTPTMSYEAVPCKSTNAFLTATVTNDSSYPLLSGEASVYFEHSFVTKTQLKSVSPGEAFNCSLGVDPTIKIDYKPAHEYIEQSGILSRSIIKTHEQKINIKNTKNEEIKLTIKEHIPKSGDEKLKVKLFSPTVTIKDVNIKETTSLSPGVRLNADHILLWTIVLTPMEERELIIKWSIEHPDSEKIDLREEC